MIKVIEYFLQALFDDDGVANSLESLAGTLKAAKRQDIEQDHLCTHMFLIGANKFIGMF